MFPDLMGFVELLTYAFAAGGALALLLLSLVVHVDGD